MRGGKGQSPVLIVHVAAAARTTHQAFDHKAECGVETREAFTAVDVLVVIGQPRSERRQAAPLQAEILVELAPAIDIAPADRERGSCRGDFRPGG